MLLVIWCFTCQTLSCSNILVAKFRVSRRPEEILLVVSWMPVSELHIFLYLHSCIAGFRGCAVDRSGPYKIDVFHMQYHLQQFSARTVGFHSAITLHKPSSVWSSFRLRQWQNKIKQTHNTFNEDSGCKTSFSQKTTHTQRKCQALEFDTQHDLLSELLVTLKFDEFLEQ